MGREPIAAKDSKKEKMPAAKAIAKVPPAARAAPASVKATASKVLPTQADETKATLASAIEKALVQMACDKSRV